MPDDYPAQWLVYSGARTAEKDWHCSTCHHTQRLSGWDDPLPRIHVATAGHQVELRRLESQDLFPVNTQPPGQAQP